jgi:hypothetical protein
MKDLEIHEKRNQLKKLHDSIWQEWQEYDEQYPVIPGAYKPSDYHEKQKEFHRCQSKVSEEIRNLPHTKLEKLQKGIILIGIIACIGLLVWYFLL